MRESRYYSYVVGELPEGCKLCVKGAKLVLFTTGVCPRDCFYCPLSPWRRKDVVYANERPVKKIEDIIEEAKIQEALGAGVTGGDPLARLDRTVEYIKVLKENFGEKFHIHLYTTGALATKENLEKLYDAGLDEIRFHPDLFNPNSKLFKVEIENIKNAFDFDWDVGGEVPAVPRQGERIKWFAELLDKLGAKFLNINELEFSETNLKALISRGYQPISDESSAIKGSLELGLEILKWGEENTSLSYHLCTAKLKDAVQLKNRLRRMAKNVAKPYMEITEDGTLKFAIAEYEDLDELYNLLVEDAEIPEEWLYLNRKKRRIEMPIEVALELADAIEGDVGFYIVEEYPTWDRIEVERTPIN
ncbi:radical SAM protein [Thermococcus sp. M39]|uniref:radical SAM protein n=1 Tax=unclassified Thermococcus TaxID=2627626 RepID=UPI001439E0CB|nr:MULTISPECIES: radical SAM protein [unclassified Thermococcus]NJE07029.1 radical SAM protein [Thermococcus sp. M39]NJE13567.1 radical SAM protein [Thermococcus sp. LS2]